MNTGDRSTHEIDNQHFVETSGDQSCFLMLFVVFIVGV